MKNIYKNTFGLQISNEFLKAVELNGDESVPETEKLFAHAVISRSCGR